MHSGCHLVSFVEQNCVEIGLLCIDLSGSGELDVDLLPGDEWADQQASRVVSPIVSLRGAERFLRLPWATKNVS